MITDHPINNHDDMADLVGRILGEAGLDVKRYGDELSFTGLDPICPAVFVGCSISREENEARLLRLDPESAETR